MKRDMDAFKRRRLVTIPFSGSTLGPRLGQVSLHLAQAVLAMTKNMSLPQKDWTAAVATGSDGERIFQSTSGMTVFVKFGNSFATDCPTSFDLPKFTIAPSAGAFLGVRRQDGQLLDLDFVYLADNPLHIAFENDIRTYLALQGMSVRSRPLAKEE